MDIAHKISTGNYCVVTPKNQNCSLSLNYADPIPHAK